MEIEELASLQASYLLYGLGVTRCWLLLFSIILIRKGSNVPIDEYYP